MTLDVLTAESAAPQLGCEPSTLEEMARNGEVPAIKLGRGGWVFPRRAFEDRLNELAIEQAKKRREPVRPVGAVVDARRRKGPPTLPRLP